MAQFTAVSIIFNPNSTGSSKELAESMKREIKKVAATLPVKLVKTRYAGHAEELAYALAKESKRPLIISASGDGGYHEVINGLMHAQNEGATPTAGLLPAGNANDHYNALHSDNPPARIAKAKVRSIDILMLHGTQGEKKFTRYAHSYVGFGLTPEIGAELNKTKLTWATESWLVIKGLFRFRPVRISQQGGTKTYDSIICSNIGQMSKYITLSEESSPTDGFFELTLFRRHNKSRLLRHLVRASLFSLDGSDQRRKYSFRTIHRTIVQLDGEIISLDAHSQVTISVEKQTLRCIV